MSLKFDDKTHTYTYNGHKVPSVTQLLQGLHSFAGVPAHILEAACQRGTAVHLACQYWDEGDLDFDGMTDNLKGYVKGWLKFIDDYNPKFTKIETQAYSPMGFAGTCDRQADMQGDLWTIDIKTSQKSHPVWGVQTSAYNRLYETPDAKRATVRLSSDGTYKFDEWTSLNDWPVFASLITLHNWGKNHG